MTRERKKPDATFRMLLNAFVDRMSTKAEKFKVLEEVACEVQGALPMDMPLKIQHRHGIMDVSVLGYPLFSKTIEELQDRRAVEALFLEGLARLPCDDRTAVKFAFLGWDLEITP